jgi:hypothetical protein
MAVRLTGAGYRTLRRSVANEDGQLVQLHTRTDDGDTRAQLGKSVLVLPRGAT